MPEPAAVLGTLALLSKDVEWSDLVAFYAAGLATFTFVNDWKRRSFTASVSMTHGFLAQGRKTIDVVILAATNPGERNVTLSGWGLLLPNGKQLVFPNLPQPVNFPYELGQGKQCQVFLETRQLAVDLLGSGFRGEQTFVGFFRDQLDNKFRSKKFKFNVDEWSSREN